MKKLGLKANKSSFYFNHAYAVVKNKKITYEHGYSHSFLAWLKKDNIVGFQFHPEKSQFNGKSVLNFLFGSKYE